MLATRDPIVAFTEQCRPTTFSGEMLSGIGALVGEHELTASAVAAREDWHIGPAIARAVNAAGARHELATPGRVGRPSYPYAIEFAR